MAPTIREVAERAGVSVSTASRVLNDYPYVSEATRSRVLAAVEELDYRPDVAARSMRTGKSRAVGFVVSDISNPIFAAVARGADDVLHARGYSLVLANSGNDPAREGELLVTLGQRRVEGLIAAIADERAPGLAERLAGSRACVLFDRDVPGSTADAVLSDHDRGFADALEHLARLGHRRVALIAGSQGQLGSRARVDAFRRHVARLGLERDRRLVRTGELSGETGYHATQELLALDEPPTAVVAGNNQLTVGTLEALSALGVRIPRDLSLVACDDVDLTRLHAPPIDVIARDLLELGGTAAEVLLERLSDRSAPTRRVTLPTAFVARGTAAAPPAVVREIAAS